MWSHFKFTHEAPNQITPNWITLKPNYAEPNQGLHCQIIMLDLCSSEILHNVEWWFLTDILGEPIGSTFKGQEIQKGDQGTT